jgi:hypothetical protein
MDIRKELGGMAEAALNDAVDKAFEGEESIFEDIGKKVADELRKALGTNIRDKIKANWIDKIDGEDDIPDIP